MNGTEPSAAGSQKSVNATARADIEDNLTGTKPGHGGRVAAAE